MFLGTLGDGWTVVQQHADVDAHDGHDAAHVQVHHEDPLKQFEMKFFLIKKTPLK